MITLLPSARPHARRGLVLGILSAVLVCAAAFFAFVMPQTPGRLGRPTAGLIDDLAFWRWLEDFLPEPSTRTGVAVAVPLAGCLVFAGYALAVALAWRWQASRRGLVGIGAVAVVLMAIGALAFPNANTDIFSYIASGRVAAVHDANPYEYPPASFPNDPLLPYVSEQYSGNLPSKLPAFMLVNVSLAELPGDDPVANLLAYRFAFLALSIASLVLLVLAARRLFPGSEAGGLVLYGWNPVVAAYGQSQDRRPDGVLPAPRRLSLRARAGTIRPRRARSLCTREADLAAARRAHDVSRRVPAPLARPRRRSSDPRRGRSSRLPPVRGRARPARRPPRSARRGRVGRRRQPLVGRPSRALSPRGAQRRIRRPRPPARDASGRLAEPPRAQLGDRRACTSRSS